VAQVRSAVTEPGIGANMKLDDDLYKVLFEQSPDAIIVIDTGTMLPVIFNDRLPELLGYTREAFAAIRIADCEAMETGAAAEAGLAGILGCGSGDCDTLFRTVAGELKNVRVIARPLEHSGQRYLQLVIRDITLRQQAERQLRENDRIYTTIFNEIGIGIALISPDMEILSMNSIMEKWSPHIDASAHPLCYQSFNVPPLNEICSYCPTAKTLQDGKSHVGITETPTAEGLRHYQVVSTPIQSANGAVIGCIEAVSDITEQKRAGEASRQSRQRLDLHVQQTPLAVIEFDLEGRVRAWNPAAEKIFGFSDEETIGRHWSFIVPEVDQGSVENVWRSLVSQRGGNRSTNMNRTKDDSIISCEWFNTPLVDPDGKTVGVASLVMDDTKRLLAEDALRKSEERYRLLADNASDVILVLDLESNNFSYMSPSVERLLGFTAEEVMKRGLALVLTPASIQYYHSNITGRLELFRQEQIGSFIDEFELLHQDGHIIISEITSNFVLNHTSSHIEAICVTRDITARKQMEEALRQSEKFVRDVIDSLEDNLAVVDDRYRLIMANRAYRDHFNVQSGDIVGKNCFEIVNDSAKPCFEAGIECPVLRTLETGQPAVTPRQSHSKLYGDRTFEIKSFPMKDTSGKITAVIELCGDTTDKLKLEEHERNIQKLESLGILAGGIAHDFNNLLAVIQGNISLAKMRDQPGGRLHELLTRSEDACGHAAQLSRQLLTFAKGGEPVRKNIQIAELVRNEVGFALSGSKALAEYSFPEHLPSLTIDDGQMGQVFQNLSINAKEAMPDGGRLFVTMDQEVLPELNPFSLPAGPYVKISFRDQGGGIPNDVIGRVFDPYFSTKEMGSRKGQGLGLTICHSIMTKHGGAITVGSVQGEGAVFSLFLPLPDAVNDPKPSPASGQTVEPTAVRRILVMDDEECLRILLADILESFGHRVVAVNNGRSAIESYRTAQAEGDPFAVVILDLTIAGEAGAVDTIKELRQVDSAVKAIITSGYAIDHVMMSYREYGFMGAVAKPYAVESLKGALEEVFSG
jgi:two-component system cell cycle sensor histidine kinase/response regulator CckA